MKKVELDYRVLEKSELLEFLFKNVSNKSKNNIKSLLKNGNVLVNNNVITKHNYMLNKNDLVIVKLSQVSKYDDFNKIDILYEDNNLLAINKPSGLLTISTEKEKNRTLYHYVSSYVKERNKSNKIFIVNRLDKDTSGIVLFTKDENTKKLLQNNWDDLVSIRKYIAIVHGITDESGVIKSYLNENSEYMVYSTSDKKGKLAITEYKKIKSNNKYSMLEINLKTGRKNQIRVHMKDINHPVLGDSKYGTRDKGKRLFLHSTCLEFKNPINEKVIKIISRLPKEFEIELRRK